MLERYKINYIGSGPYEEKEKKHKGKTSVYKRTQMNKTSRLNKDGSNKLDEDNLTLNFLWISCNYTPLYGTKCIYCRSFHTNLDKNSNETIKNTFRSIIHRWKKVNSIYINLWYHSFYDKIDKSNLIINNDDIFNTFVNSDRVKIFDLADYGYNLDNENNDDLNSYNISSKIINIPFENENNDDLSSDNISDKMKDIDIQFEKDLRKSEKQNSIYINNLLKGNIRESYKNRNYYLTPFYVKIDYSKNLIMAVQYNNKEVCKTRYSCFVDIDIHPYNFLKYDLKKYFPYDYDEYMEIYDDYENREEDMKIYTNDENREKDIKNKIYNNEEAFEKLNFFGIILAEPYDLEYNYENAFIMIDTTKPIVNDALKYANKLIEDLVKMEDFKKIKLSDDKQQVVYQMYPLFFQYLFICLINDENNLNLDTKNYAYYIEITLNNQADKIAPNNHTKKTVNHPLYDYFKSNALMIELFENLKNSKLDSPSQKLQVNNSKEIIFKENILETSQINNSEEIILEFLKYKIDHMNFLGFKYSILNLIYYIYNNMYLDDGDDDDDDDNIDESDDDSDDDSDGSEKCNEIKLLNLLKNLYYEEENKLSSKFDEDTNDINNYICNNHEYLIKIYNNLNDYSTLFYESINIYNKEFREKLEEDIKYYDKSFDFIIYNKENINIRVPIIDVYLSKSQFSK